MTQSFTTTTKHGLGDPDTLMDKAGRAAHDVAEQGRQVAYKVGETGEDAYLAVRRQIRQAPLMTVGLGIVLGFALGALWKSGGSRSTWYDRMVNNYEPHLRSLGRQASSWWR